MGKKNYGDNSKYLMDKPKNYQSSSNHDNETTNMTSSIDETTKKLNQVRKVNFKILTVKSEKYARERMAGLVSMFKMYQEEGEEFDKRIKALNDDTLRKLIDASEHSPENRVLNHNIEGLKSFLTSIKKQVDQMIKMKNTLDTMGGEAVDELVTLSNAKHSNIELKNRAIARLKKTKSSTEYKQASTKMIEQYNVVYADSDPDYNYKDEMKRKTKSYYKHVDEGARAQGNSKFKIFSDDGSKQFLTEMKDAMAKVRAEINANKEIKTKYGNNFGNNLRDEDIIKIIQDSYSNSGKEHYISKAIGKSNIKKIVGDSNELVDEQGNTRARLTYDAAGISASLKREKELAEIDKIERVDATIVDKFNQKYDDIASGKSRDKNSKYIESSVSAIKGAANERKLGTSDETLLSEKEVAILTTAATQYSRIENLTHAIVGNMKNVDDVLRKSGHFTGEDGVIDEESIKRTTRELGKMSAEWEKLSKHDKEKYNNSSQEFISSKVKNSVINAKGEQMNRIIEARKAMENEFNILNNSWSKINPSHVIFEKFKDISKFMVAGYATSRAITFMTESYYELEKAVFSLGVVSGSTLTEIKELRFELLNMATDSVYSAKELTEALDQVVKTGKTLEDAKNIVKETDKLAAASFESLDFATSSVNKAMIAFEISSNRAAEIVNQYYNAAAATPLSLRSLDESLRNAASAFASIGDFTNRSGQALEDYKVEINGTAAALTGVMSLMGRTGLGNNVAQYKLF